MWSQQGGWSASGWGQAVVAAAGGAWTPASLGSSVVMNWYDAADSSTITLDGSSLVSQWNDKSGNARHASQPNATLRNPVSTATGMPAVTGSADTALRALPFDMSWAVANYYTFACIAYRNAAPGGFVFAGTVSSANSNLNAGWASDTTFVVNQWSNDLAVTVPGYSGTPTRTLISSFDGPTPNRSAMHAGVSATGASDTQLLDTTGSALLGASFSSGPLKGGLCEIVFLLGRTDTSARQKLEGYLAWKWGVQSQLPAGHPYLSAAP